MREVARAALPETKNAEAKLADLKRMRAIALALLGLMTLIFIATSVARVDWAWVPYVRAFAEAGMVGACADWFAVVALFRHPFGIPIPHTGIVPNNKDRIGAALGRFITNNFLSPRVAHEQLIRIDVVGWIARWINDPENAKQLTQYVGAALPRLLRSLAQPELGNFLGDVARRGIESIPAAPLASKVLAVVWAGGAAQIALERALDFGDTSLRRNKRTISRIVSEHSSRWIPRWIDNAIAERIMTGLLTTSQELRNPDHPWRVELAQAMEKLIADLATDPEMDALGERLKAEVLANPLFVEQARSLWTEIDGALKADLQSYSESTARAFEVALHSFGSWLQQDPERQRRLNRWIRLVMLRALLPRRAEIGAYVTQVVQNWDTPRW